MADLKEVEQTLNTYIRPLTFPVAIKMLKSEEEIPEKIRRPHPNFLDMPMPWQMATFFFNC